MNEHAIINVSFEEGIKRNEKYSHSKEWYNTENITQQMITNELLKRLIQEIKNIQVPKKLHSRQSYKSMQNIQKCRTIIANNACNGTSCSSCPISEQCSLIRLDKNMMRQIVNLAKKFIRNNHQPQLTGQ